MMSQQVARCYAQAFYERVASRSTEVLQQLDFVWSVCSQYPELIKAFNHPFIDYQRKMEMVASLFESSLQGQINGLLALLIKKRSVEILPDIIREFRLIHLAQSLIEEVHIDSPYELTEQEKESVVRAVQSGIQKQIAPMYHIDTTLIAGICIRIGSRVIDTSLKGQLADMRQIIMKHLEVVQTKQ
jgi:F-type H+-transporting ATPase subunit delta